MLGYPFTWKCVLQKELQEARGYVARAHEGPRAFDDARAWTEVFAHRAAFMVRKLIEVGAVSRDVWDRRVEMDRLRRRADAPAFTEDNMHDFGLHYDLESPESACIWLRQLCDQIIHSDVLFDGSDDAGHRLVGFVVASDQWKERYCHFVHLEDFFAAIEAVATDGIRNVFAAADGGTQSTRPCGA